MAAVDQQSSYQLASRLNTEQRRDRALFVFVESTLSLGLDAIDFDLVRKSISQFVDFRIRDEATVRVMEYLSGPKAQEQSAVRHFLPFVDLLYRIADSTQRCRALCLAHSLLSRCDSAAESGSLRSDILKRIDAAWEQIDIGWVKIDTGFRIVRAFSEYSSDLARQYLDRTEEGRQSTHFKAFSTEWAYQACIRLAIRAFAGQLSGNHDTEEDLERLKRLIEKVSALSKRAELWAELALQYFIHKRSDHGKSVVNQYVRPLLESIPKSNQADTIETTVSIAPALYITHASTARQLFNDLPQPYRDYAFSESADFIIRKRISSDPYEDHDLGYDIDYSETVDIIDLAENIETDNAVFRFVVALADTLSSKRLRHRFTPQQKTDIVERLGRLISSKLPDNRNIKHDGYRIASEAHLSRITSPGAQHWENLLETARAIPNKADCAFVLAIVAKAMPSRERDRKRKSLQEAIKTTGEIPCIYDQITRLVDLASMVADRHPDLGRYCLKQATEAILRSGRSGDYSAHRRIIDTAFKIDPDFAASLVSLADNDPARDFSRIEMRRRLDTLRGKSAFINEPSSCDELVTKYRVELPHSAWMALGSLNAGRTGTLHLDDTRVSVRLGATYPLGQSYPILAWVIENAVQRLSNTDQATTTLRQIFESTILAAEISERTGASISERIQTARLRAPLAKYEQTMVVSAGQRDKAIRFLQEWLDREAREYVKICDQYFGPTDLEVLMMIHSMRPGCEIYVLTSKKHHDQEGIELAYEEYPNGWRRLSDQEPPKAEIVIVGIESSGKSPLHDRFWLTDGAGLKIGTSWNSLGRTQESTISVLSETDARLLESELDQYLVHKRRDYHNERVRYQTVTL